MISGLKNLPSSYALLMFMLYTKGLMVSGVMSMMSGLKNSPSSYAFLMFMLYTKGLMPMMASRLAWEGDTFFSLNRGCDFAMISTFPLVIFVEMLRAWKKLVFSGPMLVIWGWMNRSVCETSPTFAKESLLLLFRMPLISDMSLLENTMAMLPLRVFAMSAFPISVSAFAIVVFFPNRNSALCIQSILISCSWLLVMLFMLTMRNLE